MEEERNLNKKVNTYIKSKSKRSRMMLWRERVLDKVTKDKRDLE